MIKERLWDYLVQTETVSATFVAVGGVLDEHNNLRLVSPDGNLAVIRGWTRVLRTEHVGEVQL